MSRLLRQLIDHENPLFLVGLSHLEQMSGNPAVDVRLTADILSKVRMKIVSLGLDPDDTTGAELYRALWAKAEESEEAIESYLGHPSSSDEAAVSVNKLIDTIVGKPELWCVKGSALKAVFKKNPPKRVMKMFRFQSSDSLTKRMDVAEIVFAARILESKTWWTKQKKLLAALSNKDFEKSELKIMYLGDARWLQLMADWEFHKGMQVITSIECGAVGYVIPGGKLPLFTTVPLLLHYSNEVVLQGAFLKLHYVQPTIGMALEHAIEDGSMIHGSVSGVEFHWRDVQRYFGADQQLAPVDYAHLDIRDLGWVNIELQLSLIVPELAFWVGSDYLGTSYGEGNIISMNMHDVAMSVRADLGFSHMFTSKMQRALQSELMSRYLHEPLARSIVIKQFDISGTTEENW